MIALAAMLMVGVASAVQAGSRDDGVTSGGYRLGPQGHTFSGVNPVYHSSLRHNAFAFVMPSSKKPATSQRVR
jgi:hypothetical protein